MNELMDGILEFERQYDNAMKRFTSRCNIDGCSFSYAYSLLANRMKAIQDKLITYENMLISAETLGFITDTDEINLFDMAQKLYDKCEDILSSK